MVPSFSQPSVKKLECEPVIITKTKKDQKGTKEKPKHFDASTNITLMTCNNLYFLPSFSLSLCLRECLLYLCLYVTLSLSLSLSCLSIVVSLLFNLSLYLVLFIVIVSLYLYL